MGTLVLTDPVNQTANDASLIASNNAAIKAVVNGGIDSSNIADGSIVNADISPTAAIVGSKLVEGLTGDRGSQIDYVEFTAPVNVSATTEGTANLVVASSAIAYAGQLILVEFWCPGVQPGSGSIKVVLLDNAGGNAVGQAYASAGITLTPAVHVMRRFFAPTATKSYRIAAFLPSGGTPGSIFAGTGASGTDLPGFIRITKA